MKERCVSSESSILLQANGSLPHWPLGFRFILRKPCTTASANVALAAPHLAVQLYAREESDWLVTPVSAMLAAILCTAASAAQTTTARPPLLQSLQPYHPKMIVKARDTLPQR